MSETGRRHFLIRSLTTELPYNEEEESYGTVLMALPEDAQVTVHDVNTIGNSKFADLTIITTQEVTTEELARLMGEFEEGPPTPEPEEKVDEAKVIELPTKAKRKRSGPPPTAG
jgi:hypothetical protein